MTKEDHLLSILAEECTEVGKLASKSLRFGINNICPKTGLTNTSKLILELNDILAAVEMLQEEGTLPEKVKNEELIKEKKIRVKEYLEKSKDLGRLE